jgi:hypothetical protein
MANKKIAMRYMCTICVPCTILLQQFKDTDGAREKIKWDDAAGLLMMILFKLPRHLIHHTVVLILQFAVSSFNCHTLDLFNIDRSGIHLEIDNWIGY